MDVSEISNRLDSVETVGLAVRRKFLFEFVRVVKVPLNRLFAPPRDDEDVSDASVDSLLDETY